MNTLNNHNPKLVLDVGAHDGSDTLQYLSDGYNVVSIEADPDKCVDLRARFAPEIKAGRCTVYEGGVGNQVGVIPFYRSNRDSGMSSFNRDFVGHNLKEIIRVSIKPLGDIVREVGSPAHYIKIDIEGYDLQAISSLDRGTAPRYLSAEIQESPEMLDVLINLGYGSFKIIAQPYQTTSEEIYDSELGWRMLRKLGRKVPLIKKAIQWAPQSMRAKTEWDDEGSGMESGNWGELAMGSWMDVTSAQSKLSRIMGHAQTYSNGRAWYDLHAKLGDA